MWPQGMACSGSIWGGKALGRGSSELFRIIILQHLVYKSLLSIWVFLQ